MNRDTESCGSVYREGHTPLPVGFEYDGQSVVEVVEYDSTDSYQPFLYLLSGGEAVWIPAQPRGLGYV